MRGATVEKVQHAIDPLESLGMSRIPVGHEVLELTAQYALQWKLSGYGAIYVALASHSNATCLTADPRSARRVKVGALERLL